jgi:putative inorganic carbon (hco3(-)) transporter
VSDAVAWPPSRAGRADCHSGIWSWTAIVLLAWGVFALGATRPWGYLPLLAGMATYGATTFIKRPVSRLIGRGLCFSLAALCGALLLQLIPLPTDLLHVISPAAASISQVETASSTGMTHAKLDRWALSHPLSVDPSATALGLACVVALGLFFVGMVRTMGPDGARRLAVGLAWLGTIVALVGIAEATTTWNGIYGAAGLPLPPDSLPLGPFSSKNHYAGWMLMTLALTMGYLCAVLQQAARLSRAGRRLVPDSQRVGTGGMLALQLAATVMAVSVVATKSRGGILSLAFAIVTLSVLLMVRCAPTKRILVASPLVLLLLIGIVVTGERPIASRFVEASWSTANGRLPIWRQVIAIARDFPITGSGFNTYQTIVPLYPIPDHEPYEGAHNDFLQLAAEGGLLLGLPVLATIGFFIWEARQRFRESSNDTVTEWLRVGAVVGLSLIAVQETVDFSLQVPGNAALFVVLAAIAVHRAPSLPMQGDAPWKTRGGIRSHA